MERNRVSLRQVCLHPLQMPQGLPQQSQIWSKSAKIATNTEISMLHCQPKWGPSVPYLLLFLIVRLFFCDTSLISSTFISFTLCNFRLNYGQRLCSLSLTVGEVALGYVTGNSHWRWISNIWNKCLSVLCLYLYLYLYLDNDFMLNLWWLERLRGEETRNSHWRWISPFKLEITFSYRIEMRNKTTFSSIWRYSK